MFALVQNDPKSLLALGEVKTLPLTSQAALRLAYLLFVWSARSRSRKTLRRLTEAHLADIGLTRFDARAEAAKWFWKA